MSVCLSVCPSVRLSITHWYCVKTAKGPRTFSPPGSHIILVFPCQTLWHYSDQNYPNGSIECRGYFN